METKKAQPFPSPSLSTQIFSPCASTAILQKVRPKPLLPMTLFSLFSLTALLTPLLIPLEDPR